MNGTIISVEKFPAKCFPQASMNILNLLYLEMRFESSKQWMEDCEWDTKIH